MIIQKVCSYPFNEVRVIVPSFHKFCTHKEQLLSTVSNDMDVMFYPFISLSLSVHDNFLHYHGAKDK